MARSKALPPGREYSQAEILAKLHLRRLRIDQSLTVKEAARLMDITRKNLEDLETMRPYGCHVSWDHIIAGCKAYWVKPTVFFSSMSMETIEALWPGESIPFSETDCWWFS